MRDLKELLPVNEIPFEEGAAWFVAIKEATVHEKAKITAKKGRDIPELLADAEKTKDNATVPAVKKKAAMIKESRVARVRELLKQAEGGYASSPAESGFSGVQNEYGPVEMGQIPTREKQRAAGVTKPNEPNKKKAKGAQTPEDVAKATAMQQLQQDASLDQVQQGNEAEFFRAKAEEATVAAEQMGAELQATQEQAQQASQQAQMAQQQTDAAVQQSTMQAQQSTMQAQQMAMQLQATQQAAMGAQQQNMSMQQAMQDYRQQLQQMVLQDPMQQAMAPQPGSPEEAAAMEQQAAEQGGVPAEGGQEAAPAEAEAAPAEGGAPLVAINQGAAPAKPKAKPKPKKKPEGKEKTSSIRRRLKTMRGAYGLGKVERGKINLRKLLGQAAKKSDPTGLPVPEALAHHVGKHRRKYQAGAAAAGIGAVLGDEGARKGALAGGAAGMAARKAALKDKEKTSALKQRLIGAGVGAGLGAGVQSLSDVKGKGGQSTKERVLRAKLKELEGRKGKGAVAKHKTTIARALAETAKINREHPRSAAALAALTGAAAGAALGPRAAKAGHQLLKRVAARGGR